MMSDTNEPSSTENSEYRTPAVSIVMLAYNHGPYIEQAIASVLSQEFSGSFELIIGEDCSTDETAKIVRSFRDRYPKTIRLVSSETNVGMNANFKRCIEACAGEYIAFCEGDDYWNSPNKLQIQTEYLVNKPQYGAVHSDFSHIIELAGRWRKLDRFNASHKRKIPTGKILRSLLIENCIQTCTLLVRKSCIADYYASNLPMQTYAVADWPFCLYLSAHHEIAYIDEPLATYRLTPGSITNSGLKSTALRLENAMKMVSDFVEYFSIEQDIKRESDAKAHLHMLRVSFFSADVSKFNQSWAWLENHNIQERNTKWFRRFHFSVNRPVLRMMIIMYFQIDEFLARLRHYASCR